MAPDAWSLSRDAPELARLARILSAGSNVPILRELAKARRREPTGGWMYLSQIAEAIGESPGGVSLALQRMVPDLLEEKREKGLRYFRSRVVEVRLVVDELPSAPRRRRA